MKPKVIILDFDGVVIESVDLKTKAFEEMFKEDPEVSSAFMEFHRKNSGRSRFHKFQWLYENVLKKPLPENEKKALGEKFSELIFGNMLKVPYVEGAIEFLEKHHDAFPIYVASITPDAELKKIIEMRGLTGYFKGVMGTTGTKADLIRKIMEKEGAAPGEVLFVGDTKEDLKASQETGVRFVARVKQEMFEGGEATRINDLKKLSAILEEA